MSYDDRARERFLAKVPDQPETGCWLWTGSRDSDGYGRFVYRGDIVSAPRAGYALFVGDPTGFQTRHTCDNPPCVRFTHLLLGDHNDNVQDMVERNRQCQGRRHHSARLDEIRVAELVELHLEGATMSALARSFGVSVQAVDAILSGRNWKSVTAGVAFKRDDISPGIGGGRLAWLKD